MARNRNERRVYFEFSDYSTSYIFSKVQDKEASRAQPAQTGGEKAIGVAVPARWDKRSSE